jgi:hypothetical protein
MPCLHNLKLALACALLPLASACEAGEAGEAASRERPALGLMGTIPVYWGESQDFGGLVNGEGTEHWARERIEARFAIVPVDLLTEENLAGIERLMLAQPRPLSPMENVALDAWVRGGGRLLLFADPMLTGESRYAIGDRRRPQDVILLSPILDHWGLGLEFDVEEPGGPVPVRANGMTIPVDRPGAFAARGESHCDIAAEGVLARCRIGEGEAVVLADAAVLDLYHPPAGAEDALDWLLGQAFARNGEIAGKSR